MLPLDLIVAQKLEAGSVTRIVSVNQVPEGWMIADIGPKTIEAFSKTINGCKTVFWKRALGVFEIPQFAEGTRSLAKVLGNLKATTVIGGGSTARVVGRNGD